MGDGEGSVLLQLGNKKTAEFALSRRFSDTIPPER